MRGFIIVNKLRINFCLNNLRKSNKNLWMDEGVGKLVLTTIIEVII